MVSISIGRVSGGYMVYGTKMVDTAYITRPFEFFKTKQGANNYAMRYVARQESSQKKKE